MIKIKIIIIYSEIHFQIACTKLKLLVVLKSTPGRAIDVEKSSNSIVHREIEIKTG